MPPKAPTTALCLLALSSLLLGPQQSSAEAALVSIPDDNPTVLLELSGDDGANWSTSLTADVIRLRVTAAHGTWCYVFARTVLRLPIGPTPEQVRVYDDIMYRFAGHDHQLDPIEDNEAPLPGDATGNQEPLTQDIVDVLAVYGHATTAYDGVMHYYQPVAHHQGGAMNRIWSIRPLVWQTQQGVTALDRWAVVSPPGGANEWDVSANFLMRQALSTQLPFDVMRQFQQEDPSEFHDDFPFYDDVSSWMEAAVRQGILLVEIQAMALFDDTTTQPGQGAGELDFPGILESVPEFDLSNTACLGITGPAHDLNHGLGWGGANPTQIKRGETYSIELDSYYKPVLARFHSGGQSFVVEGEINGLREVSFTIPMDAPLGPAHIGFVGTAFGVAGNLAQENFGQLDILEADGVPN